MISVVVCTFNREVLLGEMLKSFFEQDDLDCDAYELIVVDNHSTDKTRSVAEQYSVRYVFEEKQGLSCARNRGIRESRGDIIAFLDDDVIVGKQWLAELSRCFEESGADAVGGRSYLIFRGEPPVWLKGPFRINLSEVELGEVRREIRRGGSLFGLNISFRRSLFETYGYFNEAVGRKGDELLLGEETILLNRILESGCKVIYEPKAVVGHIIGGDRLQWEYFKRLAESEGRSAAMIEKSRNGLVRFLRVIRSFEKMVIEFMRVVYLWCMRSSEDLIKDSIRRMIIHRSMMAGRCRRLLKCDSNDVS